MQSNNSLIVSFTKMRRFELMRYEDITGVSGVGRVAEGVLFSDGTVVINWLTDKHSTVIWSNIADVEAVHGHGGSTVIEWIDE